MTCSRNGLVVGCIAGLVSLWVIGTPAFGRDVKLVLHPQKAPAEVGKFSLLLTESALIDGDAVPLYEKAVKALPDKTGDDRIRQWVEMPIDQLPLDQVEQVVAQHLESLRAVAKAVKCRQCNWPEWKPGIEISNLTEYRRLAFVIRLWARLEIAEDGYEGAVLALQTGFGMARHLGQAPTIIQVLVGTAVGHTLCREVDEFVQREGAPNLYPALANLPKPFVAMEKAIETERKAAALQGGAFEGQTDAAHDRCRAIAKRFKANLAALQCVEAIRSYVASHGGKLPVGLGDITEVSVPTDPTNNDEPFRYVLTATTAVLESFLPPGGDEKERIRYLLSVAN